MKYHLYKLFKIAPVIVLLIGLLAISWWLINDPYDDMAASEPGADSYEAYTGGEEEEIIIEGFFERFEEIEAGSDENWPRFRGANFDNIYRGNTPLIENFDQGGNEILWSVALGEGHAGPAIYDGKVYVLDYDEEMRADMLRCFSLDTGEEIWRRWYEVEIRRNHGISRTVPAVTEDFILTVGPRGHVMCVERETGDFLWGIDMEKELGSEIPLWYTGQCPLIDDGVAVIAPGSENLLIGVDCNTGEILWETPNRHDWEMSHSSIIPFEYGGRKMYVYSAVGGAVGVAADGDDAGEVLWEVPEWNHRVVAASPVGMPDGRIFLTAGYGAGSMLIQLHAEDGNYEVEIQESFRPGEGLSSEQQTPVFVDGHLFGVLPKDARTLRNQFVSVDPGNITGFVWNSGTSHRYGLGPYILADGKFYLLDDFGTLYIIEKNTDEFRLLDERNLIEDGHDAWAPMAIADGYLLLRDSFTMICVDLKR